jgi:putative CocE/NonD family hydrolase
MGVTTLQTAVAAPPHLRTVIALFTGANYFDGWAYRSGVFELWNQGWSRGQASARLQGRRDASSDEALREALIGVVDNPWAHARQLPLLDEALYPSELSPWYYEWLRHWTYDEYWRKVDCVAQASLIRVPIMQVAGWYDLFLPGQLAMHKALQDHPEVDVRERSRLIVGPWVHDSYINLPSSTAGGRDFGSTATSNYVMLTPLALDWFDRFLRSESDRTPLHPVRYFQMGENRWVEATAWPPPGRNLEIFLHSGGNANTRSGDGVLSIEPPEGPRLAEPVDRYTYDPFDPVPTTGGPTMSRGLGVAQGIVDQSPVEDRHDVLVYTLDFLTGPLRIAGPVRLILYAASSAFDTDFTAKLVDVDPDGFCANISEGIARGRHRLGTDKEKLLSPHEVMEFHVDLGDTAHTFAPGHRVRLEVSSSNFPRFARNLNSTVHPHAARVEDAQVAEQEIHHSSDAPSRLVVSVVEP